MLHVITSNGLCWTTRAKELQDDDDISMLDARSHGLSAPLDQEDDHDTLINDAVAAAKELGLKNPILISHSMSAHTVRDLSAEYPDLSRAIVLLDPFLSRPGARASARMVLVVPGTTTREARKPGTGSRSK